MIRENRCQCEVGQYLINGRCGICPTGTDYQYGYCKKIPLVMDQGPKVKFNIHVIRQGDKYGKEVEQHVVDLETLLGLKHQDAENRLELDHIRDLISGHSSYHDDHDHVDHSEHHDELHSDHSSSLEDLDLGSHSKYHDKLKSDHKLLSNHELEEEELQLRHEIDGLMAL